MIDDKSDPGSWAKEIERRRITDALSKAVIETDNKVDGIKFTFRPPDAVNPDHYKRGGIESIDYIQAKLSPEEFAGYCRGNMLKYLSRLGHKDEAAQEMRKAIWYGERWLQARNTRA